MLVFFFFETYGSVASIQNRRFREGSVLIRLEVYTGIFVKLYVAFFYNMYYIRFDTPLSNSPLMLQLE